MLDEGYLARMEEELLEEQMREWCLIIPFPLPEYDQAA